MSRILEATCDSLGKVFVGTHHVTDAVVMTEGSQDSEGILIIDKGVARYLTTTSSDLISTLDKVSTALGEIATALSTIDAKPVGGTGSAPAPGAAGNIVNINIVKSEIDTLKGALK